MNAQRPALYVVILLLAIFTTWIGKQRVNGIFACQAALYSSDNYLGYCNVPGYGDYDHGAVWFDLEPPVRHRAADADVLFLGDSRLQFAFSTGATAQWFAANSTSYYLLGFAYSENEVFAAALLNTLRPRARVYVINVDPFFSQFKTEPAKVVLESPDAERRYDLKQVSQLLHRAVCGEFPILCGDEYAFFRARDSGAWRFAGIGRFHASPVSDAEIVKSDAIGKYAASADEFLARLPVKRECIVLTVVPTSERGFGTNVATASAIAAALEMKLTAPRLDGLQTFDGTHLDPPSAERWSRNFFKQAAPQIQQCLGDREVAPSSP